jgi:hypothetical protein
VNTRAKARSLASGYPVSYFVVSLRLAAAPSLCTRAAEPVNGLVPSFTKLFSSRFSDDTPDATPRFNTPAILLCMVVVGAKHLLMDCGRPKTYCKCFAPTVPDRCRWSVAGGKPTANARPYTPG